LWVLSPSESRPTVKKNIEEANRAISRHEDADETRREAAGETLSPVLPAGGTPAIYSEPEGANESETEEALELATAALGRHAPQSRWASPKQSA
jgi:hypothetical protein